MLKKVIIGTEPEIIYYVQVALVDKCTSPMQALRFSEIAINRKLNITIKLRGLSLEEVFDVYYNVQVAQ